MLEEATGLMQSMKESGIEAVALPPVMPAITEAAVPSVSEQKRSPPTGDLTTGKVEHVKPERSDDAVVPIPEDHTCGSAEEFTEEDKQPSGAVEPGDKAGTTEYCPTCKAEVETDEDGDCQVCREPLANRPQRRRRKGKSGSGKARSEKPRKTGKFKKGSVNGYGFERDHPKRSGVVAIAKRTEKYFYGRRGRKFDRRLFNFFRSKAEAQSAYQAAIKALAESGEPTGETEKAANNQGCQPADPISPANEERCKSAPYGDMTIAALDAAAKRANDRIDKWEKYLTAAHWRLGMILVVLRKHFPKGWEAHLEKLGIEETRWKRAKCLAEFFKTEAECRDLALEAALGLAGWGKRQNQVKHRTGQKHDAPNPHHNNLDGGANARQKAVVAVANLIDAAGGCEQAASALVQQAKGDKESVKTIVLATMAAARSVLESAEFDELLEAGRSGGTH